MAKTTTKTSGSVSVMRLFSEIRKYKVLTKEEEQKAFIAYANGDLSQKEVILMGNLRYLFSFVNQYANGTDKVLDYFQEIYFAYQRAFDDFDYTKGYKFITFAMKYMVNALPSLFSGEQMVRKTRDLMLTNKANKVRAKFFQENEREATDEEVFEILTAMGYDIKDISYIAKGGVSSLNDSASADEDSDSEASEVGEIAMKTASINEYENTIEEDAKTQQVRMLMACLTEKEKAIITMVYLKGNNEVDLSDVGERVTECYPDLFKKEMTGERVRQICKGACEKMRAYATRKVA